MWWNYRGARSTSLSATLEYTTGTRGLPKSSRPVRRGTSEQLEILSTFLQRQLIRVPPPILAL